MATIDNVLGPMLLSEHPASQNFRNCDHREFVMRVSSDCSVKYRSAAQISLIFWKAVRARKRKKGLWTPKDP